MRITFHLGSSRGALIVGSYYSQRILLADLDILFSKNGKAHANYDAIQSLGTAPTQ